ncbi:hypothetical protein D621_02005 [beta proteobacterium AAP51]|nr:hypothetical protein D621_02005 [beta proteobacterium AAP51]
MSGLLFTGAAFAQTAAPAAPAAAASAPARPAAPAAAARPATQTDDKQVIIVQGTRASIEDAISRKRRGATVSDHIVAEDVNQFPDKTIGDAMARITGVQLGRDGDSGEGSGVSIRGMDATWTRVEVDGMTQLGASINNSSNAGDLREISAELVKSIEVVKGTLPNIREGGIGGSVRVEKRKPFDFKERFVQLSAAAQHVTNIGTTTPRLAFIATDKFLNNRLGVMFNITYDDVDVRGDAATSGGGGAGAGANFNLQRDWNFTDPNQAKTFVSANAQSAAVTAKAGCAALVSSNTAAITTANLIADCNRQFNDYAPTVPRFNIRERDVKRVSADLTLQFRINDKLSTWLTHQPNQQKFKFRNFDYGFTLVADDLGSALGAMYNRFAPAAGGRAPVYNTDGSQRTVGTCGPVPTATTNIPVTLNAANLVTGLTLGDCNFVRNLGGNNVLSSSTREQDINIKSEYNQLGWAYRGDLWRIDGFIGASRQGYVESNFVSGLGINAPGLQLQPTAQNISTIVLPANFDWYNPNNYSSATLNYAANLQLRKEKTGQLDFTRALDVGPLNRLLFGGSLTNQSSVRYSSNTSSQYGTNVTTQGSEVNTTLIFDSLNPFNVVPASTQLWRPTGGAAGATPNLFVSRVNMERNITRPQMQQYLQAVLQMTPGTFMADSALAGSVPASWMAPSRDAALASGLFDGPNTTALMNTGRLTQSLGSDGRTYPQQPTFDVKQRVEAAYVRLDWDLPEFKGLVLDGNFGVRYTRTTVDSAGFLQVPGAPVPGSTAVPPPLRSLVVVKHQYNDVLPSFNLAANALGGKFTTRLGWGKVLTRPNLDSLRPNIVCTADDPTNPASDGIDNCTGGSPVLKPFRGTKTDLSFEFYPVRGSQINLAFYQVDIKVDSPGSARRFLGEIDLGDGILRSVTVPTNNEPGPTTSGVEFGVRTAFNYLPGFWRHFGADFNITRNRAKYAPGAEQFINIAGSYNVLAPRPGMSATTTNYSLWYDNGKLSGRVAVSARDEFYRGLDRRNYPWFQIKSTFVDAKVSYKFTDNLTVAVEGKNLGRQESTQYMLRTDLPRDYTWNGRRFFLTGTYKF